MCKSREIMIKEEMRIEGRKKRTGKDRRKKRRIMGELEKRTQAQEKKSR